MPSAIVRNAVLTLISCGLLIAVGLSRPARATGDSWSAKGRGVLRALHDRDLNREGDDTDVAGYYEGLLAGRPRNLLGRAQDVVNYRFRGDFLYYEARQNVDWAEHDGSGRHVTNSFGMSDGEYAAARQPGTRRVALIGDSITRGQGAPFGASFEAIVEDRLNSQHLENDIAHHEWINFSTTGYRLTQMLDVALETVPRFKPDVYVICLTRLSVGNVWGDHLAQLVYDGIDLKYPYLRELAASAGLDARDPIGTMRAKLSPFRLPAIRWSLVEISNRARRDGAVLVVAFVPTVNSPAAQERQFRGIRSLVGDLDLPLIDLLGVFDDPDLSHLRVAPGNDHPNGPGHEALARALYEELVTDGRLSRLFLGAGAAAGGSRQ
jgi:lysophospholipase L1-like esterase